jgi:hypothetical protein
MTEFPPFHRIANALVIASAVAAWPSYLAIPMAISAGPAVLWVVVFGFLLALAHALLLGLPLFALLAPRGKPRVGVAMLAGGLIGALPITILMLSIDPLGSMVVLPTLFFGFCGWLGGAAFDFVLSRADDAA